MIIRLYRQGQANVLGTINTSGTVPQATGVGEPLLETWLLANEGTPTPDITRQLETFFAGWNRPEVYSQTGDPVQLPSDTPSSGSDMIAPSQ